MLTELNFNYPDLSIEDELAIEHDIVQALEIESLFS